MNNHVADGLGTQLRRLLELLDGELEQIYREESATYTPRFTPIMKALANGEQLTIKEIAARSSVSHSAASQTIAKMLDRGLLIITQGEDQRSRKVRLSAGGKGLLPWLRSRWAATNAAAAELDKELSHPLSEIIKEAIELLEERPFSSRIRNHERVDG